MSWYVVVYTEILLDGASYVKDTDLTPKPATKHVTGILHAARWFDWWTIRHLAAQLLCTETS